jgi:hypothetical protein
MDSKKVTWFIDEYMLDKEDREPIIKVLEREGYRLFLTKYIPFSEHNEYSQPFPDAAVLYGTHGFIRQTRKYYNPGAYCQEDTLAYSMFSSMYPKEWFLNEDFEFLKFKHIKNIWEKDKTPFFLRPDSVTKTFAGHVIFEDLDISTLEQTTSVNDQTWCVKSSLKNIIAEYRYVIVNRTVVTGSQYRRNDCVDIRIDTMSGADEMVEKVAKYHWQPDSVYVCDIAETENGFKVIELNSFSCAGLYACDKTKIVNAVSEAALEEYENESIRI